jgi:hypothetical protein
MNSIVAQQLNQIDYFQLSDRFEKLGFGSDQFVLTHCVLRE